MGGVGGQGADLGAGQPEALQDIGEILGHPHPVACALDLNELGEVEAVDDDHRVAERIAVRLSGALDQSLVVDLC